MKSQVAVLRVQPDSILTDIDRLFDIAGVSRALARGKTTILKDNISWHFPFPGANTTPWQLEGTVLALRNAGYADLSCVPAPPWSRGTLRDGAGSLGAFLRLASRMHRQENERSAPRHYLCARKYAARFLFSELDSDALIRLQ